MTQPKKKALVVCPGRGTYNKPELGYLARHHGNKTDLIATFDAYRKSTEQVTVSELDTSKNYSLLVHSRGDNASPLIYACAYADFLSIDRDKYDIAAVTGNSMGWYIALGCAGALNAMDALQVVNTMGTLMQDTLVGGQVVYPVVDENWQPIPGRRKEMTALVREINGRSGHELYISIDLGGMLVFAGNDPAIALLVGMLKPEQERFPLRLQNHAAFHTPLQQPVSSEGLSRLPQDLFGSPDVPLIDGRGKIWSSNATDPEGLRSYTLGTQVVEPYNFTHAITVGVREFAPECIIILGPGNTLGGAVAQTLISIDWQGLGSKSDFIARQEDDPYVLSMGLDAQREMTAAVTT